jgi:hypothetical protein
MTGAVLSNNHGRKDYRASCIEGQAEAINRNSELIWSAAASAVNTNRQEVANQTTDQVITKSNNSAEYKVTPPPPCSSDSQCSIFLRSKSKQAFLSTDSDQIVNTVCKGRYAQC